MNETKRMVAVVACDQYRPPILDAALRRLLAPLGGIARFVAPGNKVLIKPNLLTDRRPEEAVTTHPELVRSLIRLLRAEGAIVAVGDSPANVVKIEAVWERTGFRAMCREENVELVNLEQGGVRTVEVNGLAFPIAERVLSADVLINVPKVKTHVLTTLTGAVKNLYGTIPGFTKASLHKRFPKPRQFASVMVALARILKPALSLADGVFGMEGDGPSGGKVVPLGFLAASTDTAALDAGLCRLLDIPVSRVPYLVALGEADAHATAGRPVVLETDTPTPLRRILLPRVPPLHWVPDGVFRILRPVVWVRPRFTNACLRCGLCVKACPAAALTPGNADRPTLDGARCLECCCCHEVCPAKAVVMMPSPLVRLFRGGGRP
jgi:uncharacterized protein (DUF362 family)/ferredoxin